MTDLTVTTTKAIAADCGNKPRNSALCGESEGGQYVPRPNHCGVVHLRCEAASKSSVQDLLVLRKQPYARRVNFVRHPHPMIRVEFLSMARGPEVVIAPALR